MNSTRNSIIDASLEVFSTKGYVSATTLEISKVAGVSEMTLFRHFKTKNNLFLTTIKQAMGESIANESTGDMSVSLKDYISSLLDEKINIISKNNMLVKMLIRESLSNTLPEELKFTKVIYAQVVNKISIYISYHHVDIDAVAFAETIVGLLLRYAIMEEAPAYHLLEKTKQKQIISKYLTIFDI